MYYTRLTARTSGLLLSSKGAAMYVSWMELLTFCLVIVAVIELTALAAVAVRAAMKKPPLA